MLITVLRVKFSHPNPMFQPQISKIMQELLGSDQDLTQIIGNLIVRVVTSIPHTRRTLCRCTSKRTNDCRCVCVICTLYRSKFFFTIFEMGLQRVEWLKQESSQNFRDRSSCLPSHLQTLSDLKRAQNRELIGGR